MAQCLDQQRDQRHDHDDREGDRGEQGDVVDYAYGRTRTREASLAGQDALLILGLNQGDGHALDGHSETRRRLGWPIAMV